jgi:hypothetical protein
MAALVRRFFHDRYAIRYFSTISDLCFCYVFGRPPIFYLGDSPLLTGSAYC